MHPGNKDCKYRSFSFRNSGCSECNICLVWLIVSIPHLNKISNRLIRSQSCSLQQPELFSAATKVSVCRNMSEGSNHFIYVEYKGPVGFHLEFCFKALQAMYVISLLSAV